MSDKNKEPRWFVLKDEKQRAYLMQWYRNLHGLDENNQPSEQKPPQRGTRASLKRCSNLNEAMMQRGFLNLSNGLRSLDQYHLEGLAVVAVILAIASNPNQSSLASLLGQAKEGSDTPILSELRFQRLLASDNIETLLKNLRRAVMQSDKKTNPLLLADSILHWEAEQQNPSWYTGKQRWQYQWAKDYYKEVFKYQKAA